MAAVQSLPFADLLRRYRLAAGLTQAELAERARLSSNAISALESGAWRSPHKDTVALLATALGLAAPEGAALEAAARQRGITPLPASAGVTARALPDRPRLLVSLVGRQRELTSLSRFLAGESPPLLLLAGEPGIGKSRLLEEAAIRAHAQGLSVIAGGCHRRSGQEPYSPFIRALAHSLAAHSPAQQHLDLQGCAWLVRLLPELADTTPAPTPIWQLATDQERRLMFAAVARYLANVAGPAGSLLILDDLQWAGLDALDLLAFLVREPSVARSLRVMGAYRDTEVGTDGLLADLTRKELAAEIELGSLAPQESADLLRHLLGSIESPDLVRRLLDRSGGVPFFLVSCARGLRAGAAHGYANEQIPWDIAQSIHQRMMTLPASVHEVAGVAAVVGWTIQSTLLATVTDQPEEEVIGQLEMLCKARLLLEQGGDAYMFAHDLIREVVESDLSAPRRRLVHRRVAEAMERATEQRPPQVLAYHFERGGETTKALHYLERAAESAAQVGAFAEVRRCLRRALALTPEEDQTRLYELLGDYMLGMHGDGAAESYHAALDLWRLPGTQDPLTGARLLRKQLILYFRAPAGLTSWPSAATQERLVTEARRLAEVAGDEDERWRVQIALLFWLAQRGNVTEGEANEGRAIALAAAAHFEARGEWAAFSETLDAQAALAMASGAHGEALAASQRRLHAPHLPTPERCDASSMVATAYFHLGDYDRCLATMREAVAQLRPGEPIERLCQGLNRVAEVAWFTGRWAELRALMATINEATASLVMFAYWAELHVAMARDDQATADSAAMVIERSASGWPNWKGGIERALLHACREDNVDALVPNSPTLGRCRSGPLCS
jgi:transcriptional regulator with XRE-family HTH domain/tetratricopeptide (TPR) repeat protein